MVRWSMKPLLGGCLMILAVFAPLVPLSLLILMIVFLPMTNRMTEIVQPVTLPYLKFLPNYSKPAGLSF